MKTIAILTTFKKKDMVSMKKAYDLTETELLFLMTLYNKSRTNSDSFLSKFLSN